MLEVEDRLSMSKAVFEERPNPLVELTRYGLAPGPRSAYGHHAPRGPGATPPLSAHRER